MSEPKANSITVDLSAAEARERHIESLATEIRQPIARLLPALGFRSPQMCGGSLRVPGLTTCPACGVTAPADRPGDLPWLVGASTITCEGGCELGVRELLELLCHTDEELDAVLAQITVGRASLTRFYALELRLNEPIGKEPPKWRRAVGRDVLEVLRRLEVDGSSVVRGVVVDAIDMMAAQTALRSESEIPWCDRLPLDHRGELMRPDWHGAELSQPERELLRRMAV
jgi:hypothetical protein